MVIETIEYMLSAGGKSNSLGRVNEVIEHVLNDKLCLEELYICMFSEDAWVRMRAADAFEKVCRKKPDWAEEYITRIQKELSDVSQQPSIKWHIAQIYKQVSLRDSQKQHALKWISKELSIRDNDWIVAANCMDTLTYFSQKGDYPKDKPVTLLRIQLNHKSNTVVKKAKKLIAVLT